MPDFNRYLYEQVKLRLPQFTTTITECDECGYDRTVSVSGGTWTVASGSPANTIRLQRMLCPHVGRVSGLTMVNKKYGISASISRPEGDEFLVKQRTRGAGYRFISKQQLSESIAKHCTAPNPEAAVVNAIIEELSRLLEAGPTERPALPPHWEFGSERYWCHDDTVGEWVGLFNQISVAQVMELVTINKDGSVARTNTIADPDRQCWYLIDCRGHGGAAFNIITDGEIFYPTNRITDSTSVTKRIHVLHHDANLGKATLDLHKMGPADKEIIRQAIERWLTKANLI